MSVTMNKHDVMELGFGPAQAVNIIRLGKHAMVNEGFMYYENRRLGRVPVHAIEKVLGMDLSSLEKSGGNQVG